jgi:hypothetical protein
MEIEIGCANAFDWDYVDHLKFEGDVLGKPQLPDTMVALELEADLFEIIDVTWIQEIVQAN